MENVSTEHNTHVQAGPIPSEHISGLQPGDKLYLFGSLTEDLGLRGECWTYQNERLQLYTFELLEPLVLRLIPSDLSLAAFGSKGPDERTTYGNH